MRTAPPAFGWPGEAQGLGARSAQVLIDEGARVLTINTAASALMGDGLGVVQHRLRASHHAVDIRLQALLAAATRPLCPIAGVLALAKRTGRPLIVRATPLVAAWTDPAARAAVSVTSLEPPAAPDLRLLREAFDLTPCETRLAAMLASGGGLAQAAAELEVSLSTVRTHLKAVFVKTDTHSQAELAVLLSRMVD